MTLRSLQQRAWHAEVGSLIDGFARAHALTGLALSFVSMAVRWAATFVLERKPERPSFEALDPGAFIARVARHSPELVSEIAGTLALFYEWLLERDRDAPNFDRDRYLYLACYFATLLELHGARHDRVTTTRGRRRSTATLARSIAQARIGIDRARRNGVDN